MNWMDNIKTNPWAEPDVLESAIKAEYRAKLRAIGAYVYSVHVNHYGRAAVDDFICYKGTFYAIEGKRPKGKVTARQQSVLDEVAAAGGGVIVARSWEDVWRGMGFPADPA